MCWHADRPLLVAYSAGDTFKKQGWATTIANYMIIVSLFIMYKNNKIDTIMQIVTTICWQLRFLSWVVDSQGMVSNLMFYLLPAHYYLGLAY